MRHSQRSLVARYNALSSHCTWHTSCCYDYVLSKIFIGDCESSGESACGLPQLHCISKLLQKLPVLSFRDHKSRKSWEARLWPVWLNKGLAGKKRCQVSAFSGSVSERAYDSTMIASWEAREHSWHILVSRSVFAFPEKQLPALSMILRRKKSWKSLKQAKLQNPTAN